MFPCRTVTEFFFCRQIFGLCFFFRYLGLKGSHIPNEKKKLIPHIQRKKKTNSQRAWQAHIKHVCKISGSTSQKRRWHLDFCAVNVQQSRLRQVNTWFQCKFQFGRYIWLKIGPTQSVLGIFAWNYVQTCLGAPGSGSLKKKRPFFSFCGKRLTTIGLFEGLWLVGTHVRCQRQS